MILKLPISEWDRFLLRTFMELLRIIIGSQGKRLSGVTAKLLARPVILICAADLIK